jgi:isopentenyl-diphosphate delta-isomerase
MLESHSTARMGRGFAARIHLGRRWRRPFACGYHHAMDELDDNRVAGASDAADGDSLILVDEADQDVGRMAKARCHEGRGVLHRAFSLLIFNGAGELLIQQRSASKRLWPLYWSNSCCSHPRAAESMEAAIERRLYEELGLRCPLHFLFKFQYQAQFDETGGENELCSVFIGRSTDSVKIDNDEILAWAWVSPEALQAQMAAGDAGNFTPWFKIEWNRVWRDYRAQVLGLQTELGEEAGSR